MRETFAERHVVVTGAGGGLGPAVVAHLVGAGATCHLPLRRRDDGLATRLAGPKVTLVPGVDLTEEASVVRFYGELPPLWASIHLAGGYAGGAFVDTSLADLRRQLEINLVTAFLCCREAVRALRRTGQGGRLLNVTSRGALEPGGGAIAYAAAKSGVTALTRALAKELKADGILVNAIAPATIDTPDNRAAMPRADFERWAKPAELAETIAFLVAPENTVTTGAIVPTYGRE